MFECVNHFLGNGASEAKYSQSLSGLLLPDSPAEWKRKEKSRSCARKTAEAPLSSCRDKRDTLATG